MVSTSVRTTRIEWTWTDARRKGLGKFGITVNAISRYDRPELTRRHFGRVAERLAASYPCRGSAPQAVADDGFAASGPPAHRRTDINGGDLMMCLCCLPTRRVTCAHSSDSHQNQIIKNAGERET
jgi:hypothetical protein